MVVGIFPEALVTVATVVSMVVVRGRGVVGSEKNSRMFRQASYLK